MFTGIITAQGKIASIEKHNGGMTIALIRPKKWKTYKGESISINGVCSTVVSGTTKLIFEYMPESLKRSAIGSLKVGDGVNLEQSLRLGDRLSGHMVQGHVDTTGTVTAITPEGDSTVFTIALPKPVMARYISEKGSIALDGISLTITSVKGKNFQVKILPYTIKETNLARKKVGDLISVEFDMLAKYIDQLLAKR